MKTALSILALLLFSNGVAWGETPPETTFQAIQMESELWWEHEKDFASMLAQGGVVWGGLELALAGLNFKDSLTLSKPPRYQAVAGGGYSLAALSALSVPMVYLLGDETVANRRWQLGLFGASFMFAGAAFNLRALDPDSQRSTWRDPESGEEHFGTANIFGGLWYVLEAAWDYSGKWEFMSLRDRLNKADTLSEDERLQLEMRALALLEQMRRTRIMLERYGGASLLGFGTGMVIRGIVDHENAEAKLGAIGGGLAMLGGGIIFIKSFMDHPLFPMLEENDISFSVGVAEHSSTPVFMLAGRF